MHDTMGFNHFVRQDWVRSDYHLIRGWREGVTDPEIAAEISEEFISLIDGKDEYRNTTFVVQHDFRAFFGNTLVGDGYFAKGTKIFQFKTLKESSSPDPNQPDYVCHGVGTLCDAISFAYCMEWKRIVLVGVDLYDSRYFWLRDDETIYTDYVTGKQEISAVTDRGQRFDEAHSTATAGILDLISRWNAEFQVNGVEIQVYNPKSLLSQVLSVYDGRHSDSRPQ
ncbi:hypothetical protein DFP90_11542 [Aestuariispira insulae]|uniref:Uncharacterized protein n=2 Tax=Aestuariispira insulae TaxID=1461337 RepID=A0A3D9H491_9PROT|nr:hypothetical protein DFP90_11542 [Aestuariispira insulae]